MGSNTIPSAVSGTTIPAAHHNSVRSAWLQTIVPRSAAGVATDSSGSVGSSVFKWANAFANLFTVGPTGSIEFSEDSAELVLKLGGIEKMRVTTDHLLPPGMIVPYSLETAPSQWLLCDGSAVSRTTYSRLFALVASRYGDGDSATTFNIPDLRGRFVRGYDAGIGRNADVGSRAEMNPGGATGDNIGSIEDDLIKNHSHDIEVFENIAGVFTGGFTGDGQGPNNNLGTFGTGSGMGGETRPINASLSFIIKT